MVSRGGSTSRLRERPHWEDLDLRSARLWIGGLLWTLASVRLDSPAIRRCHQYRTRSIETRARDLHLSRTGPCRWESDENLWGSAFIPKELGHPPSRNQVFRTNPTAA